MSLTLGSKNSPGSSTSAVCELKLLRKRHFSSIKNDLKSNHLLSIRKQCKNVLNYLGSILVFVSNILTHFFSLWMRLCSFMAPG